MEKHVVLCSELKQLYVAITRTRQRLWICETTGFSHPVYDFWKKLSLVEVKHLADSFANEMQVPSSKNEWRSRGFKLFHENNFRMAQLCFLKAEDKYSERLAKAHHLRAIAINASASYRERRKLFEDAAKLFNSIGKKVLAAECFYEIEDYKTAGSLLFFAKFHLLYNSFDLWIRFTWML
ncbi:TPR and ankyrin repeat-containing protein 1-like protein [Tanacetum coccineum]